MANSGDKHPSTNTQPTTQSALLVVGMVGWALVTQRWWPEAKALVIAGWIGIAVALWRTGRRMEQGQAHPQGQDPGQARRELLGRLAMDMAQVANRSQEHQPHP